jgi:hypothetical protein
MSDMLKKIVSSECRHFTAKEWKQAAAELERKEAIEEAAWKLAEHPDSRAKLAALLKLVGVEL